MKKLMILAALAMVVGLFAPGASTALAEKPTWAGNQAGVEVEITITDATNTGMTANVSIRNDSEQDVSVKSSRRELFARTEGGGGFVAVTGLTEVVGFPGDIAVGAIVDFAYSATYDNVGDLKTLRFDIEIELNEGKPFKVFRSRDSFDVPE